MAQRNYSDLPTSLKIIVLVSYIDWYFGHLENDQVE